MRPAVDRAALAGARPPVGLEAAGAVERLLVVAAVVLVGGQRVAAVAVVVVEGLEPAAVGEVEAEPGLQFVAVQVEIGESAAPYL